MEASDGGIPSKSSTATLQITVIRNLNSPVIETENSRVTIDDNDAPGTYITTVEAEDEDREVRVWGVVVLGLTIIMLLRDLV